MHRSWEAVLRPALEAVNACVIVELGAGRGVNTRLLLEYVVGRRGCLYVIDPYPEFDVRALEAEHRPFIRFQRERSLDAIGGLRVADAVLIDGDHNWFTVRRELELIFGGLRSRRGTYPLVVLHDLDWPYGRRDCYYEPADIPLESRQPFERSGVAPGRSGLTRSGMNAQLANARFEGGSRNGVRTAVEDFLTETGLAIELVDVPGHNGLGLLVAGRDLVSNGALRALVAALRGPKFLRDRCFEIEWHRNQALVQRARMAQSLRATEGRVAELERDGYRLRRLLSATPSNDEHPIWGVADESPSIVVEALTEPAPGWAAAFSASHSEPLTVVVTVYNALSDVRECVASVLRCTVGPYRLVLIDDASTDSDVLPLLRSVRDAHDHVELIEHGINCGYTVSANEGIRQAAGDVVLLNSDAVVTDRWNERLAIVAYTRPDIATVTPVTNSAVHFSVPGDDRGEALPPHVEVETMARLVARLSCRARPLVPSGCGYCLYITRRGLDRVGALDETRFPRGYGEEIEFCTRAAQCGLVHVIDDATFVQHRGGASFADETTELQKSARAALAQSSPTLGASMQQFVAADELGPLRRRLRTAIGSPETVADALGERSTLLLVQCPERLGTAYETADLASSLSSEFEVLVLSCGRREWRLSRYDPVPSMLERHQFRTAWSGAGSIDPERDSVLQKLVERHGVDSVQIQDLLGSGPGMVLALASAGLPVVASIRDLLAVCPRMELRDEAGRFCAGECTDLDRGCVPARRWFDGLPPLKHAYVHAWRDLVAEALDRCRSVTAVSPLVRDLLFEMRLVPAGLPVPIVQPGRDAHGFVAASAPPDGATTRIVCFGVHDACAAPELLEGILRADRARRRLEVHVLGPYPTNLELEKLGALVHGTYQRAELPARLRRVRPSLSLVTSRSDRPAARTLSESTLAQIPSLVADTGSLSGRAGRGTVLLDPQEPDEWYDRVCSLDADEWGNLRREIACAEVVTVDQMARAYRELHRAPSSAPLAAEPPRPWTR